MSYIKQQKVESVKKSVTPVSAELLSNSPPNQTSLALRRIQSGGNNPLQMKQDITLLQHTIGNQAIVQLLAQIQNQVSDTSAIHTIAAAGVQGSGSKLPHYDKVQASFGRHNISHVQAYTGSAAAAASHAIGAQAYATGTKIAFAEKAPSLHTAAHEAAHIVQQQAGVQLKGGVGEAGDKYERHADAVADKVVQGQSAESILDHYTNHNGNEQAAGIQRNAVQAKIGFEFETQNLILGAEPKQVVFKSEAFDIHADTEEKGGHAIEFVINPSETIKDAEAKIKMAVAKTETLAKDKQLEGHTLMISTEKWEATPQFTAGVELKDIQEFLEYIYDNESWEDKRPFKETNDLVNKELTNEKKYSDELRGFITLVGLYLRQLDEWSKKDTSRQSETEGPKNALLFMHRTSFYHMIRVLPDEDRENFAAKTEEILNALKLKKDKYIFSKDYYQPDQGKVAENALTIEQWLNSMRTGLEDKEPIEVSHDFEKEEPITALTDSLSPPLGWRGFSPRYSPGALEADELKVLLEIRHSKFNEGIDKDAWESYPSLVFEDIKHLIEPE